MTVLCAPVLALALGATTVWFESSRTDVFPETKPESAVQSTSVRLYAAQGEYESAQLCLRTDSKGLAAFTIEADALDKQIPAPIIRTVGYLHVNADSAGADRIRPDPLLAAASEGIAPNQTRAYWLTYYAPHDAKPGTHHGNVVVRLEKKRKIAIEVALEVFDVEIPAQPSLKTAFDLMRKPVIDAYRVDPASLDDWKRFYDSLAPYRIAYNVDPEANLLTRKVSGSVDSARFKEHLDYAATRSNMSAICVGGGPQLRLFPAPAGQAVQDPLQAYLQDVCSWLDERGWLPRSYFLDSTIPLKKDWPSFRKAYFRVQRGDRRIARMMCGPLNPYFERYTELWAVPLSMCNPIAQEILAGGRSLRTPLAHPASAVLASSYGASVDAAAAETAADDGYDGCFTTHWSSGPAAGSKDQPWFQIALREPVSTRNISLAFCAGREPKQIRVFTSVDGQIFSEAKADWRSSAALNSYEPSWMDGEFGLEKTFQHVRLQFAFNDELAPIALSEVWFSKPEPTETEPIPPVEFWLEESIGKFPSLSIAGHSIEPRLIPWVCWGYRFRGFHGGSLTSWPKSWNTEDRNRAMWESRNDKASFLAYPGETELLPSIRMERLRDGLEDYEYLTLAQKVVSDTSRDTVELRSALSEHYYSPTPPREELDAAGEQIQKLRVLIGRYLTKHSEEQRQ